MIINNDVHFDFCLFSQTFHVDMNFVTLKFRIIATIYSVMTSLLKNSKEKKTES